MPPGAFELHSLRLVLGQLLGHRGHGHFGFELSESGVDAGRTHVAQDADHGLRLELTIPRQLDLKKFCIKLGQARQLSPEAGEELVVRVNTVPGLQAVANSGVIGDVALARQGDIRLHEWGANDAPNPVDLFPELLVAFVGGHEKFAGVDHGPTR
jgi:hypothetical protein